MGEEDFSGEVTSELGPDIEGEVTFSGKSITNKCKVQREKRAWCISRMERRPVMKKQEVRGRYITKLCTPHFLSSCGWLGQSRQSLSPWTNYAIVSSGSLLSSSQAHSGLRCEGDHFWAFSECFTMDKLGPGTICSKMIDGFSSFLFPWEPHGTKHAWGAERISYF